jgi:hypothetical protein
MSLLLSLNDQKLPLEDSIEGTTAPQGSNPDTLPQGGPAIPQEKGPSNG